MTSTSARPASAIHWSLPAARAVPALIIAVLITFSPNHSASFGLAVFGTFALADAALLAVLVRRAVAEVPLRRLLFVRAGVSAAVGAAALALVGAGAATLLLLIGAWAGTIAILELYAAVRNASRVDGAKDLFFTGAASAVLAVVMLAVPADLNQGFQGTEGGGVLTSAIMGVGVLGAWAAITGLFLAIGGLSLKPAPLGSRASGRSA
ncbi:hypothetical protein ACFFGH_21275 [Lysobacter korlensis]|uniref:Uncharacterized protein n=1 Tax=Lysobacter korlensis TaxID=553636 RepID=A0ABV6RTS1_9GAMM